MIDEHSDDYKAGFDAGEAYSRQACPRCHGSGQVWDVRDEMVTRKLSRSVASRIPCPACRAEDEAE